LAKASAAADDGRYQMKNVKTGAGEYRRSELMIEPAHKLGSFPFLELWHYRELLYFLIWRDIKVRYKQTLLGAFWIILQPLASMAIYTLLFGILLKVPSGGIPYPLFALAGLLSWNYFASSLTRAANSVVGSAHLVTKIYFPRIVIPLTGVLSGLVDFLIAFGLFVVFIFVYNLPIPPTLLTFPAFVAWAVLIAFSFGMWFAALNVRYRDVNVLVPFLLQVWFYATPVIYPITIIPEKYRFIFAMNPMTGVILGFRWALFGEQLMGSEQTEVAIASIIISLLVTFFVLILGWFYFRRSEQLFADII
jgi:lipopolysaccharide transport system permease protein